MHIQLRAHFRIGCGVCVAGKETSSGASTPKVIGRAATFHDKYWALDWHLGIKVPYCGPLVFLRDSSGAYYPCGGVKNYAFDKLEVGEEYMRFHLTTWVDADGNEEPDNYKQVSLHLQKFVGYGIRAAAMPPFDKSRKKDGSQVVMLRPFDFLKRINCHKVSSHVCTVESKLALSEPLIPFDIQLDEFASKLRSYTLQALGQAILHSAISVGSPHGGGDPDARQISSVGITERDKVVEKSENVQKSDLAPRSLTNTVSKRLSPGLKRWQGPAEVLSSRHDGGSEVGEDPEKTADDLSAEQPVLERNAEGNEGHDEDEDDQFTGYDGGDGDEQGVGDGEEGVEDQDGGDDNDGGDDEEDGDDHRGLKDDDDDEGTKVRGAEDEDSYEAGSEGEEDEANEHGVSVNESHKCADCQRLRSGDEVVLNTQRSVCSRKRKSRASGDEEQRRRQSKLIGLATSEEAYKKALDAQSAKPAKEKRERPRSSQRPKKKAKTDGGKEVADSGDEAVGVDPRDNTSKPEQLVSDAIDTTRCFFMEYDDDGNAIDRSVQVFVDVRKILPNPDNGEFQYNHRPLNEMLVASIKDAMERPEKQKEWDKNTFHSGSCYRSHAERAETVATFETQGLEGRGCQFVPLVLCGRPTHGGSCEEVGASELSRCQEMGRAVMESAAMGIWRKQKMTRWRSNKTITLFCAKAIRMTPDTELWNQSLNNKFVRNWSNLLRPFMCLATNGNAVWQLVNRFFDMWEKGELPGQDGVRPVDQEGRPGEASGAGPAAKTVKWKKELVHYVQSNKSPNGYYVCVHDPPASAWKVFGDFTAREMEMALDLILAGKVVVTTDRTFAKKLMNMNDLYTEVRRERYMVRMLNYVLFKLERRGQREWNDDFFIEYDDIMKRFKPHGLTKEKWEKKKMKLPVERTNNVPKRLGGVDEGKLGQGNVGGYKVTTEMYFECPYFINLFLHEIVGAVSQLKDELQRVNANAQHILWDKRKCNTTYLPVCMARLDGLQTTEDLTRAAKKLSCHLAVLDLAPHNNLDSWTEQRFVELQQMMMTLCGTHWTLIIFGRLKGEDYILRNIFRKMRRIDARIYNEALEPEDRFDIMDNEEDTDDDEIDLPLPDARNHATDKNMRTGALSGGDRTVVEVGGPTMASCKTAQLTHTQTSSAGDGTEASTSKWKDKRGAPRFPTLMRQMFDHVMEMPTENQTRGQHDDAGPEEDDMCQEDNPLFHIPDDEDKDLTPGDEVESHMKESKGGPHFLDTKFTETEAKKGAGEQDISENVNSVFEALLQNNLLEYCAAFYERKSSPSRGQIRWALECRQTEQMYDSDILVGCTQAMEENIRNGSRQGAVKTSVAEKEARERKDVECKEQGTHETSVDELLKTPFSEGVGAVPREKMVSPGCGGEEAGNTKEQGEKKATTDEDAGDAGDGGAQRVPSGLGDPLSAANTGMSSHGGWSRGEHDTGDALVFGGASPRDTTKPLADNRDEGDKLLHMVCTGSGSQIALDLMEREEGGGMEGVRMTHGRETGNDDEEADGDANLEHNMDVDNEDGLGKEASCRG
ncbi:hypothetical protein CBR_g49692 [Chara braunii]|uniref:Ubiquitin-like protease family profile domain-containing protein n=1 Tax=Chara braunii TaxID=69332 RepID=A0A388M5U3_CHABU|nr:hypothetical protein CBR_g49692 [Chara braunii]|eukprot:GBG89842.1 hypothetical protein CBR_g49692 [Chara braunii]